jgi:cell division protein FtsZ
LLEDASVRGARGVIINVTGGPDMSLLEVNEALTIIQESAHDDANIIFGAVVDPSLAGRVKITVIATGFEHARSERSTPAAAPMQTPVDLHAYTVPMRSTESAPGLQPRATIVRRPALDLPFAEPRAVAVGQNGGDRPATEKAGALPGEFDLNLELDVPAFLRRSEG